MAERNVNDGSRCCRLEERERRTLVILAGLAAVAAMSTLVLVAVQVSRDDPSVTCRDAAERMRVMVARARDDLWRAHHGISRDLLRIRNDTAVIRKDVLWLRPLGPWSTVTENDP